MDYNNNDMVVGKCKPITCAQDMYDAFDTKKRDENVKKELEEIGRDAVKLFKKLIKFDATRIL